MLKGYIGLTYNSKGIGPVGGKKIGALGDSYTSYVADLNATNNNADIIAYLTWMRFFSNGAIDLRPANVYAASGKQTDYMIAQGWHTSLAADKVDFAFVCAGSNDPTSSPSPLVYSQTIANLATIYNTILASGAIVVAKAIPTRNSLASAQSQYYARVNAWIREQARTNSRIIYFDPKYLVTNSTTGDWITNYTHDGTHYAATGAMIAGKRAWEAIKFDIPPRDLLFNWYSDTYDATNNPQGNQLTNGLMTGTAGTKGTTGGAGTVVGNVADSWTVDCSAAAASILATCSKVTRNDGIAGEWQQIVVSGTSPNTAGFYVFLGQSFSNANFADGDIVDGTCEIEIDPGFSNLKSVGLLVYWAGATYTSYDMYYLNTTYPEMIDLGQVIKGVSRIHPATAPTGQTGPRFRLIAVFKQNVTVAATIRVGRCLFNKTNVS